MHRKVGIAAPCRIDRAEHLREEVCIWQIALRNSRQRKVEIQIDDAARLNIGVEYLCPRNISHLKRQRLRVGANVRTREDGDRRECSRSVGRFLRRLERGTVLYDACKILGGHRRLFICENLLLRRLALSADRPARREHHERLVRIFEEGFADQLLEIAFFQPVLEVSERVLIVQIGLRRAVIEPHFHHADAVDEPLRRGTEIRLAQTELDHIERGADQRPVEPAVRELR